MTMAFAFTDEQQAFAETVRDLLSDHATGEYARAVVEEPTRWRELWGRLTELGVPGLAAPEAAGGLGLGAVEIVAVAEAAGAFLAPVPLVATMGAFVPAVAWAAPGHPEATALLERLIDAGDAATLALPADARVAGRRLTASSEVVVEAGRAAHVALTARGEGGEPVLVVCAADALPLEPLPAMDETRPVARLHVEDLDLGDALVLPVADESPSVAALVSAAAELVGLAAELVRRSVDHASERTQFGAPIGSFQAVKHRLVDAHVATERARSLTYRAAVVAEAAAARLAKAAASEAALDAARAAVQVHGGIGITREHDVSLMYLRARQAATLLGSPDELHRLTAAEALAP